MKGCVFRSLELSIEDFDLAVADQTRGLSPLMLFFGDTEGSSSMDLRR
jgi:hypothetical protein